MRVVLLLITVLPISASQSEMIRFDQVIPGRLPADWTVAMTHAGAPPRWEIVRDESAPAHQTCSRNYREIQRPADFRWQFGT
jgi:hypothetical protein